jgi:hypothetical protein
VGAVPAPAGVVLEQEGAMRMQPGGHELRFRARQWLAPDDVAFAWEARFPLAGPLALRVVDRFDRGEGELCLSFLGLPVQRRRGPEVSVGEALRYLAEVPWVPHALGRNRRLELRELDHRRVEVSTLVGGERAVVELASDEAGDIVGSSSRMRRRKVGREWVPTPWGGAFGDYESVGLIRVPTSAEAYWDLGEERFVYFRATLLSLELL